MPATGVGWTSWLLWHDVPNAAYVLYELLAELLAQRMDVDLHSIALHFRSPPIQFLFQLHSRHHHAGTFQQRQENGKLSRGNYDGASLDGNLVRCGIQ